MTILTVKLPVDSGGNDPADWLESDAMDAIVEDRISAALECDRRARGEVLSQTEIDKRMRYLDLCMEWLARTGKPLIAPDEEVRARYAHELRLAGVL